MGAGTACRRPRRAAFPPPRAVVKGGRMRGVGSDKKTAAQY